MNATQFYKQDRVMRLMRVLTLFQAKPHGVTTREIANRLEVSQRTVQRDLLHLQSELHVPFVEVGSGWVLPSQFFLAPVSFNVHEGMAMLLSVRLMLRFADKANLFTNAAYEKVAAALPAQVKAPMMETADQLSGRRQDPDYLNVLTALTSAWAERRKVVITYRMDNMFDRNVWPLFIEPNPTGHSCYLVAWDPKLNGPRNYRLERISAVRVLEDRFDAPLGFSIARYLAHAWGIWTTAQPVDIELRFLPQVAKRVKETTWHESQQVEDLPDGSVRVRLVVAEPTELMQLMHWVLLGLRWSDIDTEQRQARVRMALQRQAGGLHLVEPKTARSKRVIALTQLAIDALKREKARQAHQQLFAGSRWRETGLVFTSSIGTPLEPRYVLRRFQELLLRLGIEKRRFHDLRHSCATLLLTQGVAARVVMEILGHSQYKLTMDTYSHVIPALENEAANKLDIFLKSRPRLTAGGSGA